MVFHNIKNTGKPAEDIPEKGDIAYIEIRDFKFIPNELNITPGTTVVWINKDWAGIRGRVHKIVGHDNAFKSPRLYYNDRFNFTFTEPGAYTYVDATYRSCAGGTAAKTARINV